MEFNNESATTMETRLARKRKANADAIASGKENQPLDAISTTQLSPNQIRVAEPTEPSSGYITIPSSSQSPTVPASAPTPSLSSGSHPTDPSNIADTVDNAFSLTMPPAAGQVAMTQPDIQHDGNVMGLESLADEGLCTFPSVLGDTVFGLYDHIQ